MPSNHKEYQSQLLFLPHPTTTSMQSQQFPSAALPSSDFNSPHHPPPSFLITADVNNDFQQMHRSSLFSSSSFYHHDGGSIITDSPQARALAASRNHKEAEKRRRERINSHLDRLRSILPCCSKADKATLLAKVIQRLKELKQETSELIQVETFPSETDEITVLLNTHSTDAKLRVKVSLCCEDRPNLISDLIETLKSLGLSLLAAEIVTFGGRIRNIVVVECVREEEEYCRSSVELVQFLKEALRSLVERSCSVSGGDRRRIFNHIMK